METDPLTSGPEQPDADGPTAGAKPDPQPPHPMSGNQKLAALGLGALILGALAYGGITTVRQLGFLRGHGHSHSHSRSHRHGAAGGQQGMKDHHDPSIRKQDFGRATIAGVELESITQEGPVAAGEEGAFNIVLADGQKAPKAMRAWIGIASSDGSVKTKLEKEPKRHYHSHVEAPSPLPPGSQYWLEVEPETGPKGKASFTYFTGE